MKLYLFLNRTSLVIVVTICCVMHSAFWSNIPNVCDEYYVETKV